MNGLGWLIGCIFLDICVIISNVCEHVLIIKGWKNLDRIDHLLLSLSVSDLVNGLSTLFIDSWYLARKMSLNVTRMNETSHTPCFGRRDAENKTFTNETTHFLEEHHSLMNCIFETVFLFTVFVSVLHVTAIAFERICAVRFPRKYYIFNMAKTKCLTIISIWIIATILTPTFAVLPTNSTKARLIRGITLAILTFTVFVMYVCVAYFLFKQHKSMVDTFSADSDIHLHKLRRLTAICLFLGTSYITCIAPIIFAYLYQGFYHDISNLMVTINSLINPCIYFVKVYHDRRDNRIMRRNINSSKELISKRPHGATVMTMIEGNDSLERRTPRDTLMQYQSPMASESPTSCD